MGLLCLIPLELAGGVGAGSLCAHLGSLPATAVASPFADNKGFWDSEEDSVLLSRIGASVYEGDFDSDGESDDDDDTVVTEAPDHRFAALETPHRVTAPTHCSTAATTGFAATVGGAPRASGVTDVPPAVCARQGSAASSSAAGRVQVYWRNRRGRRSEPHGEASAVVPGWSMMG